MIRTPRTFRLKPKTIEAIEGLANRSSLDKTKVIENCIAFCSRFNRVDFTIEESKEIRIIECRNTLILIVEKEVETDGKTI